MSLRNSQRLIAFSFIIAVAAMIGLFVKIFALAGLSLPSTFAVVMGLVGWALMAAACVTVLVHPDPESTFLGRYAFTKEPLLSKEMSPRKRTLATYAVVSCALIALFASFFFFTDTARVLYDRYLF